MRRYQQHNAQSFMQNIKRHTIKLHVSLHIPIDEYGTNTQRKKEDERERERVERWKKRHYNHFKHQHPLLNSVRKVCLL